MLWLTISALSHVTTAFSPLPLRPFPLFLSRTPYRTLYICDSIIYTGTFRLKRPATFGNGICSIIENFGGGYNK